MLDIAQNSIRAEASLITIGVIEDRKEQTMEIFIEDNGCGMTKEQVEQVMDPFFTTRTTRKVGLGVPLFKMSAEATGGNFSISSQPGKGTKTTAFYHTGHIDMMPLGDMDSTLISLISVNPDIDFCYIRSIDSRSFTLDTREIKEVLGKDVPINAPEILVYLKDLLRENTEEIGG